MARGASAISSSVCCMSTIRLFPSTFQKSGASDEKETLLMIQHISRGLLILLSFFAFVPNTRAFTTRAIKRASLAGEWPQRSRLQSSFLSSESMPDSTRNVERMSLLVSNLHHLGSNDGDGDKIHLILASQSPRRREILDMLGLKGLYTAIPSPLDESVLQKQLVEETTCPLDYTRTLAEKKAEALSALLLSQDSSIKSTLVLGSDTIVDLNDVILEKPSDTESAVLMLSKLSGEWHRVHTGVAIYHVRGDNNMELMTSFTDTANVKFADLTREDIEAYVATGEPMDKAGSYGIQGIGGQLVECIEGDFFSVMGLPMHRTSRALSQVIDNLMK